MVDEVPGGELCAGFSSPGASASTWEDVLAVLSGAEVFWLTTVRPDGRAHVTPVLGAWVDGHFCFCTGPGERKAANLRDNPSCVATTGCNGLDGLDVVIEGTAVVGSGREVRSAIADGLEAKYDGHLRAPDGTWAGLGDSVRQGEVLAYRVAPRAVFAFGKGTEFSQTRWTLADLGD